MKTAGRGHVRARLKKRAPRAAARLTDAVSAAQVETLVEAHPLHPVLPSMPGTGVRTCARILTEIVGKDFKDAGHLASYAGIAPVTRRSGTSIRGDHTSHGMNLPAAAIWSSRAPETPLMPRTAHQRPSATIGYPTALGGRNGSHGPGFGNRGSPFADRSKNAAQCTQGDTPGSYSNQSTPEEPLGATFRAA